MAMTKLMPQLQEDELVYVLWSDSGYSLLADRWQNIEEVKKLKDEIKPIETVGFLIDETEDYITLGQSVARSEKSVRGGYIILKKNIIKRFDIKKVMVGVKKNDN